jgi:8-oxo-dGTP pyrophosphatase MutT (NUDIX family)
MRRRPSARLVILNASDEVLLFRFENKEGPLKGRTFWATPGGGLEADETFDQAARRELFEETGIQANSVGQPVWKQEVTFRLPSGEDVLAVEHFFLIRISSQILSRDNWTPLEEKLIVAHRWWSIRALKATEEVFFPENLPDLIQSIRS